MPDNLWIRLTTGWGSFSFSLFLCLLIFSLISDSDGIRGCYLRFKGSEESMISCWLRGYLSPVLSWNFFSWASSLCCLTTLAVSGFSPFCKENTLGLSVAEVMEGCPFSKSRSSSFCFLSLSWSSSLMEGSLLIMIIGGVNCQPHISKYVTYKTLMRGFDIGGDVVGCSE